MARTAKFEIITPAMAADWLQRLNVNNRKMKPIHVKRLAAQIRGGRWKINGETVSFFANGNLCDGQNRLAACVEAGIAIEILVARGLDNDVYDTVDGGVKRTLADVIDKAGGSHSSTIASAARLIRFYEFGGKPLDWLRAREIETSEILEFMDHHPGLADAAARIHRTRTSFRATFGRSAPTALAYLVTSCTILNVPMLEPFLTGLETGENLRAGDARYTCREYFSHSRGTSTRTLRQEMAFCYLVKAWNAYVAGRRTLLLHVKKTDDCQRLIGHPLPPPPPEIRRPTEKGGLARVEKRHSV